MIVLNMTIMVDHAIAESWKEWIKQTYIPALLATNCFERVRFFRLLDTDETEGLTYAVQCESVSKADYNRYITLHANGLRDRAQERWGAQYIGFNSVLQLVD